MINQADYIWHPADFVHHEGRAFQRNLSVDEEDGSASLRVDFETEWSRPGGYHHADTEWYVLSGSITSRAGMPAQKNVPAQPLRT